MSNARGSSAQLCAATESTYGVASGGTYYKRPFVSSDLDGEQTLIQDDLLGLGRDDNDPGYDVVNVNGSVTYPMCARNMGLVLRDLLGPPTSSTATDAASGKITFTAQPAVNSTITLNGTVWTAVASGASGNQWNVGANLAASMTALAAAFNASVETQTAKNTYTADATSLTIVNDTLGISGNAYTIAVSGTSNASVSAGTLLGGTNTHTFVSGATTLPSQTLEFGNPEVPNYTRNLGATANSLQVDFQRGGWLNAVVNYIAQNYADQSTSVAGSPSVLNVQRMSNLTGAIKRDGVQLAKIGGGSFNFSNNLDANDDIRPDGAVGDIDPAKATATLSLRSRFANRIFLDQATNRTPCAIDLGWSYSSAAKVTFTFHRFFVPKPKKPITNAGAITINIEGRCAKDPTLNKMMTVALVNDVAGTVYA